MPYFQPEGLDTGPAHTGANADKNQKYKGCIFKIFFGFLCASSQERKTPSIFLKTNFWNLELTKM